MSLRRSVTSIDCCVGDGGIRAPVTEFPGMLPSYTPQSSHSPVLAVDAGAGHGERVGKEVRRRRREMEEGGEEERRGEGREEEGGRRGGGGGREEGEEEKGEEGRKRKRK